jgi:hypothetical protein
MKRKSIRTAAIVLAASLAIGSSASAEGRDRAPRERGLPKIVKILKKLVGIETLDDLPLPPPPKP